MLNGIAVRRPAGIFGAALTAGIGMLPKLTCPLCWPAYTGALSALGLGFVDYTPYLLPLTALFVAMSLLALGLVARTQRSALPLIAGAVAGAALLVGKFVLSSEVVTYAAIGLFIIAAFLPLRRGARAVCACDPSGPATETKA
jgi:mercuric ion transport protein